MEQQIVLSSMCTSTRLSPRSSSGNIAPQVAWRNNMEYAFAFVSDSNSTHEGSSIDGQIKNRTRLSQTIR